MATFEETNAYILKAGTRRIRRIRVAFELWTGFLRGDLSPVSWNTCPEDLQVLGVMMATPEGARFGDVDVLVSSATFDPLPEDEEVPLIDPIHYGIEYLRVRSNRGQGVAGAIHEDKVRRCEAAVLELGFGPESHEIAHVSRIVRAVLEAIEDVRGENEAARGMEERTE